MDYRLKNLVENELEMGEKLLWSGQPNPKISLMKFMPIVALSIFGTVLALFWIYPKFQHLNNMQVVFPLLALALLMMDLWLPYSIYRQSMKMIYVVTDKC